MKAGIKAAISSLPPDTAIPALLILLSLLRSPCLTTVLNVCTCSSLI
jgi:hypothetical protein